MSDIEYLLNAFEEASQHADPASVGYGEKRKALLDRIAELGRENEALKRAGYVVSMALLQSGTYHTLCDDETKASVDAFKPRLKDQSK